MYIQIKEGGGETEPCLLARWYLILTLVHQITQFLCNQQRDSKQLTLQPDINVESNRHSFRPVPLWQINPPLLSLGCCEQRAS